METMRFALILTPDGEVFETSWRESVIAMRVAGLTELAPGGQIVMSIDVNATSGRGFVGWAKGFMKTFMNRVQRSGKVDKEIKRMLEEGGIRAGWNIGNLYKGRYYSPKSGQTFNEKSFAIDIRGVSFEFVKQAGEAMRKKFDQEAVLLVDHSNGKAYLMD